MPTQMGSTLLLPESFKMTIGIFVIGSIINPRIFISTSMTLLQHNAGASQLLPAPAPVLLHWEFRRNSGFGENRETMKRYILTTILAGAFSASAFGQGMALPPGIAAETKGVYNSVKTSLIA